MEAEKWTYVVVISEHNIAELYSCLHFKPARVITIASPYFSNENERFCQILSSRLPDCHISSPSTEGLNGDNFLGTLRWAKQMLLPQFNPEEKWVLNVTGGTKAMILALEKSLSWDEIHYKSVRDPQLETWRLVQDEDALMSFSKSNCKIDIECDLTVLEAMNLYPIKLHKDKTEHFVSSPPVLALAEEIGATIDDADHIHFKLEAQLEKVWRRDKKYTDAWQLIPWHDFNAESEQALNEIQAWCEKVANQCDRILALSEQGLSVLCQYKRSDPRLSEKRWLEGRWLEDLLVVWLKEAGIVDEHIHKGLNIKTLDEKDNQGSELEIDLCILRHQKLYMIEVKAGVPNYRKLSDAVRQITRFNKNTMANKGLFIGPWAVDKLTDIRTKNFTALCKGSRIRSLKSKQELLDFIL